MKTLMQGVLGVAVATGSAFAQPRQPPTELVELARTTAGTWKCKGEMHDGAGGKVAVTATNKVKLELDKWWIASTLEVKGPVAMKLLTYTTYDTSAKKWRRVSFDNLGGQMVGTADAQGATFNLDMIGPLGGGQFRDHTDPFDPRTGLHVWGEMSRDKGKSWTKVYDMTCKK